MNKTAIKKKCLAILDFVRKANTPEQPKPKKLLMTKEEYYNLK